MQIRIERKLELKSNNLLMGHEDIKLLCAPSKMRKYYEFNNSMELNNHLKYWSNSCGDLHYHGEYDLKDISELPKQLQRAYKELWKEGCGCFEYLVEYDEKYYIALISEFDDDFASNNNLSMDELFQQKNGGKYYGKIN